MKTIAKNSTRKIAAIRDSVTTCKVYTESNYFIGAEVDQEHAWAELSRFHFARLIENEPGRSWTISLHSNRWYELRAGAPAED